MININVSVQASPANDKLQITAAGQENYGNPPTVVLDNATGKLYRIIDREFNTVSGKSDIIKLDRPWEDAVTASDSIWLILPPVSGGKNADIEVYQRIIRF